MNATQPAWIRHPWLNHAFRRRPVCELLVNEQNMRKAIYSTQAAARKVCAVLRGNKRKRQKEKGRENHKIWLAKVVVKRKGNDYIDLPSDMIYEYARISKGQ